MNWQEGIDERGQPPQMMVSIEFLGMQRAVTKTPGIEMPIKEKTMVKDALDFVRGRYPALNLDEGTILISVNQEIVSGDRILRAGDRVSFLPPIGGG